jgi:hypothetical protein
VRLRLGLSALAAAVVVAAAPTAAVEAVAPNEGRDLEAATAAGLGDYWTSTFRRLGRLYVGPSDVVWYDFPTFTGCGITSLGSSTYCRVDRTIYLDAGLFTHAMNDFGDFAAATILAHEWGHEVQDELGLFRWSILHRYWIGKELQADCYAGLYARHVGQLGLLQDGDIEEATGLLASLGDDARMKRNSPQAHGTPVERMSWFLRGYQKGSLKTCKSVYSVLYKKRAAF